MTALRTRSIIDDLEEQVEHWRQRAEAAEALLKGAYWDVAVPPLTLCQTRIMRLLAERSLSAHRLSVALADYYPRIVPKTIHVMIFRIRAAMPEHLRPVIQRQHDSAYLIPDRAALREFLEARS
jgi:hypothetical protein